MKIKNILTITTFLTTFVFALAFVNISTNSNQRSRAKIYNFLVQDKALWKIWNDKSAELKLQSKPDAMADLLRQRKRYFYEIYNERLNADTSDLPEDFKESWAKLRMSEKYLLELIYQDKFSQTKSIVEISEEIQSSEKEFRNVVNKYGFELNEANLIVLEVN
jgi:hypothetical protein